MATLRQIAARIERKRKAHRSTARDLTKLQAALHAQLRAEVAAETTRRDARRARADQTATGQLALDLDAPHVASQA
ncbi:hypothetical protein V5F77_28700 [Xanthobacter sp. DSM 24535]|uniref:hypothetical protein n=1 Tax=Roseixanthobacter psychrophilus TaxID=3119917 RepID=UPI003726AB65